MRRPVRRSRLLVLASLVTLVAGSVLTTAPAASRRTHRPMGADQGDQEHVGRASRVSRIGRRQQALRVRGIAFIATAAAVPEDTVQGARREDPRADRPASGRWPSTPPVQVTPTDDPAQRPPVRHGTASRSPTQIASRPTPGSRSVPTTSCRPSTRSSRSSTASARSRSPRRRSASRSSSTSRRAMATPIRGSCTTACTAAGSARRSAGRATATATAPPTTRSGTSTWIVSRTADPTGVWDLFFWGFLDQLPDFPSAGTSTDKVAFTGNLFTLAPNATCDAALDYAGSAIVVLDWAEILALGGSNFILDGVEILFSPEYGTPRVGLQVPATSATLHVILDHLIGPAGPPYHAIHQAHRDGRRRHDRRPLRRRPDDPRDRRGDMPSRPTPVQPGGYARHGIDRLPPDRRDLAERSLHLGLDERLHAERRSHGAGLRPRDAAEHRRSRDIAADPRPGLPDRRGRRGQLLRRDRPVRERDAPRRVDPLVGRRPAINPRRRPRTSSPPTRPTPCGAPRRSPTASAHRSPAIAGATTSASRRTRRSRTPSGRGTSSPPAARTGRRRSRSSRPAAPRTSRSLRCGCSTVAANRRRDRHLQREHAQVVPRRRLHVVRRQHPGRRDRGDRQRDGHRPDGGRLRRPSPRRRRAPRARRRSTSRSGHAGQQRDLPCAPRTARCPPSTRRPPARRPTSSSTSPATSCPAPRTPPTTRWPRSGSSTAGRLTGSA